MRLEGLTENRGALALCSSELREAGSKLGPSDEAVAWLKIEVLTADMVVAIQSGAQASIAAIRSRRCAKGRQLSRFLKQYKGLYGGELRGVSSGL